MMHWFVRGAGVLLLLGLAGVSLVQEEARFALAGAAISALIEIALALRARRGKPPAEQDRSRVAAGQVAYAEQDGALTVTLAGNGHGRGGAPYVLLSRTSQHDRPYLELSDPKWSVHGGIQEATLSPGLLRLALDPHAAEVLGTSQVCVSLETPSEQRRLERALRRILRGVPFTSERSMPEEDGSLISPSA